MNDINTLGATLRATRHSGSAPSPCGSRPSGECQAQGALDQLGEVLRTLDEPYVSIGYRRPCPAIPEPRFVVTIECEGKPLGVQASAATPSEALAEARRKRIQTQAELDLKAAIEAEYMRRTAEAA